MRVILPNSTVRSRDCRFESSESDRIKGSLITGCFDVADTIEITDADWNEIYASYYLYVESNIQYDGTTIAHVHKTFATYLRELLELKRCL